MARLNADVVGFQEVWDEVALKAAVARSGLRFATVAAPGAETGAIGTPRLGLATRLAVEHIETLADFAAAERVVAPELGGYSRFERPVLHARLRSQHGPQPSTALHVLVVHLKS